MPSVPGANPRKVAVIYDLLDGEKAFMVRGLCRDNACISICSYEGIEEGQETAHTHQHSLSEFTTQSKVQW